MAKRLDKTINFSASSFESERIENEMLRDRETNRSRWLRKIIGYGIEENRRKRNEK